MKFHSDIIFSYDIKDRDGKLKDHKIYQGLFFNQEGEIFQFYD